MNVFQLQGQTWTQAAADIRIVKGLKLGRWLSSELDTLCSRMVDSFPNLQGLDRVSLRRVGARAGGGLRRPRGRSAVTGMGLRLRWFFSFGLRGLTVAPLPLPVALVVHIHSFGAT